MLGVDLSAVSGPVLVTSLKFHVVGDNDASFAVVENDLLATDFISSCSLFDSNGVLVGGPETVDNTDTLTFDGFTIGVGKGKTKTYKVSCNFTNTATSGSNDDAFAVYMNWETDVAAETTSGTALTGRRLEIGNSADAGVNSYGSLVAVTVIDSGAMAASLNPTSPASNIILGSSSNVLLGSWDFAAINEAFEINKLMIANSGDDVVADVVRVSCVDASGATTVSSGYLSNGLVLFANLNCYM